MPYRWRIPDTEPPFTLHISLPHDQAAPGESLATAIIHAMDLTVMKLAAWVILSQHLCPHWMHFTRSATRLGSICSEDVLRTSSLCPQEEMLTSRSYSGEGFDYITRAGIAFNDEIVDLRAKSQLPPLQAISYASLGRILRVIWDLCKQHGYRTWKFDIFVEQGPREVLVGNVALHNDL